MHEEAIKGLLENLQRQEQQPQQPEQQPEPDHPQIQISEVVSQAVDNPLLEQNLTKAWYYQCPLCSVKVNTDNDKAKSFDEFIRHIVTGMYYFYSMTEKSRCCQLDLGRFMIGN